MLIRLWMFCLFCCVLALPTSAQTRPAPIYVTLWFDTEDYVLPQSDDAAKRLAEMLTQLGIKATFKLVGEKARSLEQRQRADVIAALKKHEIGYHANTHSQQPTIAVYLQHADWLNGAAEFERREGPGVRDIERLFGVTPICYGQPGSSWAPQSYPALRRMGIPVYLDESNHVGIDEQPFYYGNMLNITNMRTSVVRMELNGGDSLATAQAKFAATVTRLRQRGGGTISIYYHPCEFIHTEFWDGVNFRRGANPPRSEWKLPGMKAAPVIEKGYSDFAAYMKFIQQQAGVQFVTVAELQQLYREAKPTIEKSELLRLAKALQSAITFQPVKDTYFSAAELFALLNDQLLSGSSPALAASQIPPIIVDGPARVPLAGRGSAQLTQVSLAQLRTAAQDVQSHLATHQQMPSEIWVGSASLAPADYLATLASAIEQFITTNQWPQQVNVRTGVLAFEKYVSADSPKLWGWVIFPEGFQAPKLMEHARLQAWTLKPAVLKK